MLRRLALLVALIVAFAPFSETRAHEAHGERTPQQLAEAVERRASRTDFAALERFGEQALRLRGRERLNRLYHVAWIYLNQSEYEPFKRWNGRLAAEAAKAGDHRYQVVARLNHLAYLYDEGDTKSVDEMRRIAASEEDWFARTHAIRLTAYYLMDDGEIGAALKMLTDADAAIPENDPYGRAAHAGIWEITGLALMELNDLKGSVAAFSRFEFEFSDPAYPRPDFDSLYNLTALAVQVGDQPLAERLYASHHRLSHRTSLTGLKVWDANLCAKVAEGAGNPRRVLACLKPLGEQFIGAEFLRADLLPIRAIARARVGDTRGARRDQAAIRRLEATGVFGEAGFPRRDELQAELLFAEGRPAEAYALLRKYSAAERLANARRFSEGIHQVTGDMQNQLALRREQLETARRNALLSEDKIHQQRWIVGIAAAFFVTAIGLLAWQFRTVMKLRHARLRAEVASRAKTEFLANMSHEIRTPLNGVVAMADALAGGKLNEREREMVDVIRSSGATLDRLLSDILDLARIESGQVTIEPAPFHVGDTVRAVAGLSRLRADEKGIALEVVIDPALEGSFVGDPVRVRQVLTNLVSNAVKFTEKGYVRLTAAPVEDGRIRFEVIDTGVGFDDTVKSRVFSRFQQADGSITRRFGGSGLGLAISRNLAELMGGKLDCESTPGGGSRFWFEVGLPSAEAVGTEPAADAIQAAGEERPLSILLADDHPTNREVVELMLADTGAELVTVVDGREAVDAFEARRFDLVLMDMQMPVMDGLSATAAIRAYEGRSGAPRTPVIILSANALPEHIEAGRRAGADSHLSKPITMAGLFAAIDAVLDGAPGTEAKAEAA